MNIGKPFWGLVFLVLALALAPTLFSQAFNGAFPDRPIGRGFEHPVTGQPFSATRTITHVETLANGTTINHSTVISESRDSSGRTYSASTSNGSSVTSYRVFDPVAHQSISWNSKSKTAEVVQLPTPPQSGGRGPGAGWQGQGPQGDRGPRGNGLQPNVQNLGTTSLDGVNADGTLVTRTIPIGKDGNSAPIVSTRESWFSPVLKIELKLIETDPRNGTTTDVVSNLTQGEPDESLFQVPSGYTVQTHTGRGPRGRFGPPPPPPPGQ